MQQIIEIVKRIWRPQAIVEHSTLMNMVESYLEGYDHSWRELALVADRLEHIGKAINEKAKAKAHIEAVLEGHDGKHEFMGNEITLRTLPNWNYVSTPYMNKCEQQLADIAEQMKPFKEKEKATKDSIKSEQKRQQGSGEATKVSETQTIAIKRK